MTAPKTPRPTTLARTVASWSPESTSHATALLAERLEDARVSMAEASQVLVTAAGIAAELAALDKIDDAIPGERRMWAERLEPVMEDLTQALDVLRGKL